MLLYYNRVTLRPSATALSVVKLEALRMLTSFLAAANEEEEVDVDEDEVAITVELSVRSNSSSRFTNR